MVRKVYLKKLAKEKINKFNLPDKKNKIIILKIIKEYEMKK